MNNPTATRPAYRVLSLAAARRKGLRPQTWTAGDLAATLPANGEGSFLVSFGHVRGEERFGTQVVRRAADGGLVVTLPDGSTLLRHPSDRALRVLVR